MATAGSFLHRPATRPHLTVRLRAWWSRGRLDRALADGARPESDPALRVRAERLRMLGSRRSLAAGIDSVLDAAEGPPRSPRSSSAIRVASEEVLEARAALIQLAQRLRDPEPVEARGVAVTRLMLSEGDSPLYLPKSRDSVWELARAATFLLDAR